jgi:hypothetical protein
MKIDEEEFLIPKSSTSTTFEQDENLPNLPLPKLEDTLKRYYKNLLPFGSKSELENSRKVIDEFKNGIGSKLHQLLEEKASKEKNWVIFFIIQLIFFNND